MLLLADELPDSIEIYSLFETNNLSEAEPITIPVSRMGEYYLKSKYDSPIEERFENLLETIKRSLFSTQEVIKSYSFQFGKCGINRIERKGNY